MKENKKGVFQGPPPVKKEILDAIKRKEFNISYCNESESQKLDIYFPNEEPNKRYPVIVYFHGGAFRFGEKDDDALEPMLEGVNKGYVVISAQYRLSKEALFPAQVLDAKTVIRWVKANAEKYNLNPNKVAVWGPSSGGWLASMVGATYGNPAFEDLSQGYSEYSSEVHAVINWCGPTSGFLEMDKAFKKSKLGTPDHNEAKSPESLFLGMQITKCPELVRLAAPITYIHKDIPPFLIIHGGSDQVVPVEQSQMLYEKIKDVAGSNKVELFIAKGQLHHGAPWYHEKFVSDLCFDFLERVFK